MDEIKWLVAARCFLTHRFTRKQIAGAQPMPCINVNLPRKTRISKLKRHALKTKIEIAREGENSCYRLENILKTSYHRRLATIEENTDTPQSVKDWITRNKLKSACATITINNNNTRHLNQGYSINQQPQHDQQHQSQQQQQPQHDQQQLPEQHDQQQQLQQVTNKRQGECIEQVAQKRRQQRQDENDDDEFLDLPQVTVMLLEISMCLRSSTISNCPLQTTKKNFIWKAICVKCWPSHQTWKDAR
ncbi:unnamed protein product [Absidia cylindrospora]